MDQDPGAGDKAYFWAAFLDAQVTSLAFVASALDYKQVAFASPTHYHA